MSRLPHEHPDDAADGDDYNRRDREFSPSLQRHHSRTRYGAEAPGAQYFATKPIRPRGQWLDTDELDVDDDAPLRRRVWRREPDEYAKSPRIGQAARHKPFRPNLADEEAHEEFTSKVAAFKLPGLSLIPLADVAESINEESEATPTPSRALNVYESRYTGDGVMEGLHSASLTIRHDSQGPRGRSPWLFRWLHIQQDVMNLDSLSDQILQLPGLPPAENAAVLKLIHEVKKNYSKPVWTSRNTTVRHMAPAFRQVPLRTTRRYAANPDQSQNQDARNYATWICIPYLALARYGGLEASADPASYPTETLLQSSYARVARKRDMAQVVRQVGIGDDASCFHIPQLWSIVVGDSLLVTCGVMSQAELRGDVAEPAKGVPTHKSVTIVSEPPKESNDGARILVYHEGSLSWIIPAKECPTYFSFVSRFKEFWPRLVRFHYGGHRLLDGRLWERVIHDLRYSTKDIVFVVQVSPPSRLASISRLKEGFPSASHALQRSQHPESPHRDEVALPERSSNAPTLQPGSQEFPFLPREDTGFHVFAWVGGENQSKRHSHEEIESYMSEINEFFASSASSPWDRLYSKAESCLQSAVYSYLLHKQQDLDRETEDREELEDLHAERVRLYTAAETLHNFFLPPQFEGAVSSKYWGAIMKLITDHEPDKYHHEARRGRKNPGHPVLSSVLWAFKQHIPAITALNELLGSSSDKDQASLQIPDGLIQTWILIVMALVGETSGNHGNWSAKLDDAMEQLRSGIGQLVASLSSPSLNESAVVLPMDLVVLMLPRLLSDVNGQFPGYSQIYSSYLQEVEAEIMGMRSDISFQNRINLAQQEISVVQKTVETQNEVIRWVISAQSKTPRATGAGRQKMTALSTYPTGALPYGRVFERNRLAEDDTLDLDHGIYYEDVPRLSPTDPHGIRSLLLRECANILRSNAQDFSEYQNQAGSLEQMNANKVSITKDRQEQLIYAFTVVTIIFLPLGTVSSIFGMNTSDIRDMELGQWAFWATAIPVSVVVILAGLYMVGAFEQIAAWAAKKIRDDENVLDDRPPPPYKRHAEDKALKVKTWSAAPRLQSRKAQVQGLHE